jgi:hypothetical protein
LPQACGCNGTANVCGNLPDGGACSNRLEVEAGTTTGTFAVRPFGGIMQDVGTTVCWTGVSMAGATHAALLYSTGSTGTQTINVTLNGATIGTLSITNCGAWDGNCTTATTTLTLADAGSLTGTLCLVQVTTGWSAAVDYLDIIGG